MKIKIWNKKLQKKKIQPDVYLDFVECDDEINIKVVDIYGNGVHAGIMCSITPFGIKRACSFNKELGFKTTKWGYIKTYKEGEK